MLLQEVCLALAPLMTCAWLTWGLALGEFPLTLHILARKLMTCRPVQLQSAAASLPSILCAGSSLCRSNFSTLHEDAHSTLCTRYCTLTVLKEAGPLPGCHECCAELDHERVCDVRCLCAHRASMQRSCHCKKSQCLKLYCDCFANNQYCSGCACHDCKNIEANAQVSTLVYWSALRLYCCLIFMAAICSWQVMCRHTCLLIWMRMLRRHASFTAES